MTKTSQELQDSPSNELVQIKEESFLDSLRYAQGILKAISPPAEYVRKALPHSFLFQQPKNIIGGDFFWMTQLPYRPHETSENPEHTILVLADCTGHGVSGALLSIAFYYILTHVVHEHGYRSPSKILSEIRKDLKRTFFRHNGLQNRDGMDIAILSLDHKGGNLLFSSANIPLYAVNNKELTIIKGIAESLSCYSKCTYEDTLVPFNKDTCFYLSTDGYIDQFGGPKNRKFMRRNFFELLLSVSKLPMKQQYSQIKKTFETWKNGMEQTDDVMVLGLRFD